MTSWDELTAGLTDVVGRLPDGAVLRLYDVRRPDDGRYAQLWQRPEMLFAEIPGNQILAAHARLTPRQEERLAAIGWNEPGWNEPGRNESGEHSAHWWLRLPWPAPAAGYRELAGKLVTALREALGIEAPAGLAYRAWLAPAGSAITLPELRLERLADAVALPAEAALRLADAVDGERDAQGRPVVRGPRLGEPDRSAVARYLRDAPIVVAAFGFDPDPFDAAGAEMVPLHIHTDGVWVWSESLAYFADRYGIAPQPELLRHLAQRQYRLPELDDEQLIRAARLVGG